MDKSIRQVDFQAKPGEPVIGMGNGAPAPLSESERKVLMNWHNGDVTVGEILAHRHREGLPFGVLRGGWEDPPAAPVQPTFDWPDGPEAA